MLERIAGGFSALVGQAILFAAMHLPVGGSVDMLVFGLTLGVWRWRRRTLLPVILAHMFINTLYCTINLDDWTDLTRVRATVNYIPQMNDLSKPPHYVLSRRP
jgi:membrane protease YdiL (CAAX protease family)